MRQVTDRHIKWCDPHQTGIILEGTVKDEMSCRPSGLLWFNNVEMPGCLWKSNTERMPTGGSKEPRMINETVRSAIITPLPFSHAELSVLFIIKTYENTINNTKLKMNWGVTPLRMKKERWCLSFIHFSWFVTIVVTANYGRVPRSPAVLVT